MSYTEKTKPGLGDPYWYEWSVGEKYIIDMLNPDSNISSVVLQSADVPLGLDDVVVRYNNGQQLYIQVKHTRIENSLTFGDLVCVDKSGKSDSSRYSLLGELANAWNEARKYYNNAKVCLFTNRNIGNRQSTGTLDGNKVKRPALKVFLESLWNQLDNCETYADIKFPEYEDAWKEWTCQLNCIEEDDDKLLFLKSFEIKTDEDDLASIEITLVNQLAQTFQVAENVARQLLVKMDGALRKWTTSMREESIITAEDVMNVLSTFEENYFYNHDLVPAEPFFESRNDVVKAVEEELLNGEAKVVFLSGVAGTGKTNIVSKICGKRDSLVDIRYYAFEPIEPEKEYIPQDVSRRVNAEVFWDELLNQLRRLLKGKLFKYKVPVTNTFLSLSEKRKRFLEIADTYARDSNNSFIVAIDGIDHAARAGDSVESFLNTLPDPEYMPEKVKFLLSGQPKENYRNYPGWIYDNSSSLIKEIEVPAIEKRDIEQLVSNRFKNADPLYKFQIVNIINRYSAGNTLAAIFALHELSHYPEVEEFERHLKERKLSGNIQAYYEAIWTAAVSDNGILFLDYKLAGALAFVSEPIDGSFLSLLFSEEKISVSTWNNVLKTLRPLLLENNGAFMVMHNDVRIFLSTFIKRDKDHVKEVYSNLADYYLNLKQKNTAYYHDVLRFLKYADRLDDFDKAYSTDFILSAYVEGVELEELEILSEDILSHFVNKSQLDWASLRTISCGLVTIEQIRNSQYEIEDDSIRKQYKKTIRVSKYECFVEKTSSWNYTILEKVFSHVDELVKNRELDRATLMLSQWFSGLNVFELYQCIKDEIEEDVKFGERHQMSECFAQIACLTKNWDFLSTIKELSNVDASFAYDVIDSTIIWIFNALENDELCDALCSLKNLNAKSLVDGIISLLKDDRINDIRKVELALRNKLESSAFGLFISLFARIICDGVKEEATIRNQLLEQIKSVSLPNRIGDNYMAYYSMYALVLAYLSSDERSAITAYVTDLFISNFNRRNRNYIAMFFNSICYVGKWLKNRHEGKALKESVKDLEVLFDRLFFKSWSPNDYDIEIKNITSFVLKAFIILSKGESEEIQKTVNSLCDKVFASNPVNQLLDPGMLFYKDCPERVSRWYNSWIGESGTLWDEPLGERNRIYKALKETKDHYSLDYIDLSKTEEALAWSVIGYASHKEYSVDDLLNWYNILVDKDASYIDQYSETIKRSSEFVETLGDNRIDYILDCKFYSDVFSRGLNSITHIFLVNHYLEQMIADPSYIVEGLIGYLKTARTDRKDLLKIWALGMSLVDWRDESNHSSIVFLQKAIEICARRQAIAGIDTDLRNLGAAYANLLFDPARYIVPDRWCDESPVYPEYNEQKTNEVIEQINQYLSNPSQKSLTDDLKSEIIFMIESGNLSCKYAENLLLHELEKDSITIHQNTFIKNLIKINRNDFVDKVISDYFKKRLNSDASFLYLDLSKLVEWKAITLDEHYAESGVVQLLEMHRSWRTCAGRIPEPKLPDAYDYVSLLKLGSCKTLDELLIQIILLFIKSDDADAVRTALTGLFALLRVDYTFIALIEENWETFHYRAKEWLLMIYELLWDYCEESHSLLTEVLKKHCSDDDFNIAIYSNIILANKSIDGSFSYIKTPQKFFSDIPDKSSKKLLFTNPITRDIDGRDAVLLKLERMAKYLDTDCLEIENRVADYVDSLPNEPELIPLQRRGRAGYKVICDKINKAFFNVLYKDWVRGRWDGQEAALGREILSSSEPAMILLTPSKWPYNEGYIIKDTEAFVKISDAKKNVTIDKLLTSGIQNNELLIAGALVDYTHNQEILGYRVSYFDAPAVNSEIAAETYETNTRIIFQSRSDFTEYTNYANLTLHHNGIESFHCSSFISGFSKLCLEKFGWKILQGANGITVVNNQNTEIGKFEYYYGFRGCIGNRVQCHQPLLMRWLINNDALEKALDDSNCPYNIKTVTDCIVY